MLTSRQKGILKILVENYSKAQIITSSNLADEMGVTSKTIQNDIKSCNFELAGYHVKIETIPGKGYKLDTGDEKSLLKVLNLISDDTSNMDAFTNREDRLKNIMGYLLFKQKPVLSDKVCDKFYVSRSQLSNDIKEIKKILNPYELNLVSKSKQGITIDGNEYNKRLLIIKENIDCSFYASYVVMDLNKTKLSQYILDAISYEKYEISDFNLQSFIIYVETAMIRIKWGASLTHYNNDIKEFPGSHEYRIVQNIFTNLKKKYQIEANEYEISNLATIIKSIRIKVDENVIDEEIDAFVVSMLDSIRKQFQLDFSNDVELRINLARHIPSLLNRAKQNVSIDNHLLSGIKQSLTLAYDIAMIACRIIQNKYDVNIHENEVGYVAVYFAMALNHVRLIRNKKRVLIITSSRNSEALLLKYNFLSKFKDQITSLDVIQASMLSEIDESDYDVVFATVFPGFIEVLKFDVIHINYFLDERDILTIETALKKRTIVSKLNEFFDERLFFLNPKIKTREDTIHFLCDKMNEIYHFDETYDMSLYQNVTNRELLASTVFTNSIALPHPEMPFAEKTMTAVAILDQPIDWDGKDIQIVFLMNIQKNGEKEMELLYDFLSQFISNKNMQCKLKKEPNYQTLESLLLSFTPSNDYNL